MIFTFDAPFCLQSQERGPGLEGLLPQHLDDLYASGLDHDTIRAAGLYSESDPARLGKLLRWKRPANHFGSALVIPFVDPATGKRNGFARIKPDAPRKKAAKYESPYGSKSRAYFTADAIDAARTRRVAIGLVEGEKKALAATQAGLPTIGISGVWNWQKARPRDDNGKPIGERILIDDLAWIDWRERPVWIGFDFDERRNGNVNQAAAELARVLHHHGAIVTTIKLPPGSRDDNDLPTKMAVDDYLVAFGADSLRRLVADQMRSESEQTRSLSEWRGDLSRLRVRSLSAPGVYLDRSPPGGGKSYADTDAIKSSTSSLVVLPSHDQCSEFEKLCDTMEIMAVAFPKLTRETCRNFEVAERVLNSGLSVSQAVCPSCSFAADCVYHGILGLASDSNHQICTHHRGAMSFAQLARGRKYIAVHEDAADFLRPSWEIGDGLESVLQVVDVAIDVAKERQSHRFHRQRDLSEEYFFRRMYDVTEQLIRDFAARRETDSLQLPVPAALQPGCDRCLYEAMERISVWPKGDSLQLAKLLTAGEICELVIRVDQTFAKGGIKKVSRSICAIRKTPLPDKSAVWFCDATANHKDIEALAGRSVYDATPRGQIEQRHPIVQIPTDVTKRSTEKRVRSVLRGLLSRLPYQRVGVIAHREHVSVVEACGRVRRAAYFRGVDSRGSNSWQEACDCLIVLGTPRVPPTVIKHRLIQTGKSAAAGRSEDWVAWKPDYWSGITTNGNRVTIQTLAYRDHDWHHTHQQIVKAELKQSIGRARSVTGGGIPVLVVTTEDLALPILDDDVSPLTDSEEKVLAAIKKLSVLSGQVPTANVAEPSGQALTGESIAEISGETSTKYLLGGSPHSTRSIAEEVSKDGRWVLRMLANLERRGFVRRVGQRGGWFPCKPPMVDLYAAAGFLPSNTPSPHFEPSYSSHGCSREAQVR